jgi:uncharacterized protein YbaP (TraB family)
MTTKFLLALCVAPMFAGCQRAPEVAPLVYSVSTPSGVNGYVLATAHQGVRIPGEALVGVKALLAECGALNAEMDTLDKEAPARLARALGTHLGARHWIDIVPGQDLHVVASLGKKAGIDALAHSPSDLHPVALAGLALRQCDGGTLDDKVSMDAEIQAAARRLGVPIVPLENTSDVAEPLFKVERKRWAPYLIQADNFVGPSCRKPSAAYLDKVLRAFRAGDAEALREATLVVQAQTGLADVHTPMVFGREPQLVSRVVDGFANNPHGKKACTMVGAAHLAGDDGVLRGLKRAGFEVRRLAPPPE